MAFLASAALARGPEQPAPGVLAERVVCRDDPSESYALYLPSAYSADRRWPIVFALDPRSRALVPAGLLKDAAERYGFVLASSYNSLSDEVEDHNAKALGAMWRDTQARLSLDERRAYAVGFSGTARAIALMADLVPGSLAGVVLCGAGFAPERAPRAGLSFAIFAAIGETDFNYQEVQRLAETLDSLAVTNRVEGFAGAHQWPPAALLSDALAWFEVRGMQEGRRPRDPALAAALFSRWQDEAAALEAAGSLVAAERRQAGLARDFEGLGDAAAAREAAQRIRGTRAYADEQKRRLKGRQREQEYEARGQRALALLDPDDAAASLRRALAELGIADLQRRASGAADAEERLTAQRSLAELAVQTCFYLPRTLLKRGEPGRAALVLAVAAETRPDDPEIWYALARARAQAGWKRSALEALERAVGAGLRDAARIQAEPELAPLHGEAGYRTLVDGLSAGAKP